jgi:hypothetical protein
MMGIGTLRQIRRAQSIISVWVSRPRSGSPIVVAATEYPRDERHREADPLGDLRRQGIEYAGEGDRANLVQNAVDPRHVQECLRSRGPVSAAVSLLDAVAATSIESLTSTHDGLNPPLGIPDPEQSRS